MGCRFQHRFGFVNTVLTAGSVPGDGFGINPSVTRTEHSGNTGLLISANNARTSPARKVFIYAVCVSTVQRCSALLLGAALSVLVSSAAWRPGVVLQGNRQGRPHLRVQHRRQRRAVREDRRDGHRHHQARRRPERRNRRRRQRARAAAVLLQARHLRAGARAAAAGADDRLARRQDAHHHRQRLSRDLEPRPGAVHRGAPRRQHAAARHGRQRATRAGRSASAAPSSSSKAG